MSWAGWAGRGLQPHPQRFWAGRGLQPRPQRFIETAATFQRSETGCKPVPAQISTDVFSKNLVFSVELYISNRQPNRKNSLPRKTFHCHCSFMFVNNFFYNI